MEGLFNRIYSVIEQSTEKLSQFVLSHSRQRGALLMTYRDVGHAMNNRHVIVFATYDEIKQSRVHDAESCILDTYNVQTHFVVIVTIGVSKTAKQRGMNDGLVRYVHVPLVVVDGLNVYQPHDLPPADVTGLWQGLGCRFCNKLGDLRKCGRCKCVRYCSKVCQIADYECHKKVCGQLPDVKHSGRVELKKANLDRTS